MKSRVIRATMASLPVIAMALFVAVISPAQSNEPPEVKALPVWPADGKSGAAAEGQFVFRDSATGESSFLGRVFSFSPVRYIGKISYGIYLLHAGLFSFLARLDHNRFMGAIEQRWIVAIPLRVALTVFVAALSFKFFESPILR